MPTTTELKKKLPWQRNTEMPGWEEWASQGWFFWSCSECGEADAVGVGEAPAHKATCSLREALPKHTESFLLRIEASKWYGRG